MIRFAYDYRLLPTASKSAWLREEFIREHPVQYQHLDNNALRAALKRDKKIFEQWKSKVGRMTLARGRLLELYLSVAYESPFCRIVSAHINQTVGRRYDNLGSVLEHSSPQKP